MLFLDGIYVENKHGKTTFQRTNAPTQEELARLVHTISHRVAL
ncbi:MAG: IS91 family transposase, partial [Candidatus Marinimicrobia bacterium]|nr:IS91 family transposase [Candidatus Neomarinimicrobiota bacterium]MBT7940667.1 IS91 family transposase [Candidatus Neomarinimicrobiota bacterium]